MANLLRSLLRPTPVSASISFSLLFYFIVVVLSPFSLGHRHSPLARHSFGGSILPYAHEINPRHAATDDEASGVTTSPDRVVLPTNVRPLHYNLTLEPHFQLVSQSPTGTGGWYTFDGHAAIDIVVSAATSNITFNSKRLNISDITLEQGSDVVVRPESIDDETDPEITTLFFSDLVDAGQYALHIQYSGIVDTSILAGLYACPFTRADGSRDVYFTTQFEAADARRAFPSWDEPSIKADYTVTLVASRDHEALSNMPVAKIDYLPNNRKAVHFETSPPMSSYLVAFAIGELGHFETNDFRVPIRIYAPPSVDVEDLRFAAETAAKGMAFYEKTLGVDFPLAKLDILSISLMNFGGMENWGLVTIVQDWLPVNNLTTAAGKKEVADVVLHELAHMWFGDLVTLEWWNDIWLNEGFADSMQNAAEIAIFPDWKMSDGFLIVESIPALRIDGVSSSHALHANVTTGTIANNYFDGITYAKGASIIEQMRAWIGPSIFYDGIHHYLEAHKYGNVDTPALWAALSEATGRDVGYYMNSWVEKPGYPIIVVEENAAAGTISLRQSRFLESEMLKPTQDMTVWPIHLMIRTRDAVNSDVVMTLKEQAFQLAPDDFDFYLLNADHAGFWRVSYPTERIWNIANAIVSGSDLISQRDVIGLVSDTCKLAPSGRQTASNCLELVAAASKQMSSGLYVWQQVIASVADISDAFWFDDELSSQLESLMHDTTAAKAHELGWRIGPTEPVVDELFKTLMFYQAGKWGDDAVIRAARDMFWALVRESGAQGNKASGNGEEVVGKGKNKKREMRSHDPISVAAPSMWKGIMCLGVRYGGDSAFHAVVDIIHHFLPSSPTPRPTNGTRPAQPSQAPLSPQDELLLDAAFSAQGCTPSKYDALRSLNLAATTPSSPSSGSSLVYSLFASLRESPTAVTVAWDWLTKQGGWDKLVAADDAVMDPVTALKSTAPFLHDAKAADEVRVFFADKVAGGLGKRSELSRRRSLVQGRMAERAFDGEGEDPLKAAVELVLAGLEQRAAWAERDESGLREWFGLSAQ